MKKKTFIIGIILLIGLIVGIILFINKNNEEITEPIIKVSTINKKINAYTGSFCDNKKCVDKLGALDVDYEEEIIVLPGEKIYFEKLTDIINNVKFYKVEENKNTVNYEEQDIEINNEEKYIVVPNYEGTYIVVVDTKYKANNILYSFKVKIKNVSDETKNMIKSIKENLIKDGHIDAELLESFRIIKILEYGYYPSKPDTKYIQANMYITCKNNSACIKGLTYNDEFVEKEGYNYVAFALIFTDGKYEKFEHTGFSPDVIQTGNIYLDLNK